MLFYCIWSVTWPECDYNGHSNYESHFAPPNLELWEQTESSDDGDESDYAYLANEEREAGKHGVLIDHCQKWPNCPIGCRRCQQWQERYPPELYSRWINMGHAKWVTKEPITREQFNEFVSAQGLVAECKTMGSLTGFGWMPAISFRGDEDSITSCYVTPLLGDWFKGDHNEDSQLWERIESAVFKSYDR